MVQPIIVKLTRYDTEHQTPNGCVYVHMNAVAFCLPANSEGNLCTVIGYLTSDGETQAMHIVSETPEQIYDAAGITPRYVAPYAS